MFYLKFKRYDRYWYFMYWKIMLLNDVLVSKIDVYKWILNVFFYVFNFYW